MKRDLSKLTKVQLQMAMETTLQAFQRNVREIEAGKIDHRDGFNKFLGSLEYITSNIEPMHEYYNELKEKV